MKSRTKIKKIFVLILFDFVIIKTEMVIVADISPWNISPGRLCLPFSEQPNLSSPVAFYPFTWFDFFFTILLFFFYYFTTFCYEGLNVNKYKYKMNEIQFASLLNVSAHCIVSSMGVGICLIHFRAFYLLESCKPIMVSINICRINVWNRFWLASVVLILVWNKISVSNKPVREKNLAMDACVHACWVTSVVSDSLWPYGL